MATLSGNDGVERYWHNARDRSRLALCRNGKMLKQLESRRTVEGHGLAH